MKAATSSNHDDAKSSSNAKLMSNPSQASSGRVKDDSESNDFQTAASSLLALGFSPQPATAAHSSSNRSPFLNMLSDVATNKPDESSRQVGSTKTEGREGQKITPGIRDVLCGRGRGYFNHPGNRRMLDIVNQNKGRYKAAGKTMKTIIVRDVTDIIQAGGTRFLKLSNSNWHEVSALEAHKKVCHCLREEKNNAETSFESAETRKIKQVEMVDHLKQVKEELLMGASPVGPAAGDRQRSTKKDTVTRRPSSTSNSSASSSTSSDESEDEDNKETAKISSSKELELLRGAVQIRSKISAEAPTSMPMVSALAGTTATESLSPSERLLRTHDDNGCTKNIAGTAESHVAGLEAMGMAGLQNNHYGIVVGEPGPLDVLFGIDPAFATTSGNIRLRQTIRTAVGYSVTSVEDKLLMARGIVGQLKLAGARFLTRQNNGPRGVWFVVADVEAEALIFRSLCEEENTTKTAMLRVNGFGGPPGLFGVGAHPFATAAAPFGPSLAARNALLRAENEGREIRRKREGESDETGDLTSIYAAAAAARTNFDFQDIAKKGKLEGLRKDTSMLPGPCGSSNLLRPLKEGLISEPVTSTDQKPRQGEDARPLTMGPALHDVVCGRGRGNFRHPGNRRLLRIFQEHKHRYRAATKTQKTKIAKEIVKGIQSRGGRFLKRTDDGDWIVVCDKEAFRKVCHGIRDIPKDQDDIDLERKAQEDGSISSDESNSDKMSSAPEEIETDNARREESREEACEPNTDASQAVRPKAIEPEPADVVCGRGRGNFSHPGNRRMLNIIHRNRERYRHAPTKAEKAEISREVMAAILSNGGRFLKRKDPESDVWEEVEFKDALKKVCHGIRDSLGNGVKAKTKKSGKNAVPENEAPKDQEKSKSKTKVATDKLLELAEMAQKRASSEAKAPHLEEVPHGLNATALRNPAMDPFFLRKLQAERAAAAGIPMHAIVAAQQMAAASGMTVEEVILAEQRKGRQCVIS